MPQAPVPPPTPEELILRFREQGDAKAIGDLFDATAPHLFRVALAVAPDAATAEDAVQETYLEALRSVGRWDASRPVVPWLVGILRMKALEGRRRTRRAPDPARLPPRPGAPEPADAAATREDEAMVHEALEDLPEPYRNVSILRWRYGLTPAQIAHARGEPAGTVWSLLSRAADRLRRTLARVPAFFLAGRGLRGLEAVRGAVVEAARIAATATPAAAAGAGAVAVGGALMAKKVVVLAAGLLLIGGGAVWLGTRPTRETPSEAAAPAAALEPAAPPSAPPLATAPRRAERPAVPSATARDRGAEAPAAGALRGLAADRDGPRVGGAIVYALPKGLPGTDDIDSRPHATTDDGGRFVLDLPSPRGHWIGAVAPDRLPAFADGDAIDPAAPLSLVFEQGAEIAVRAVDVDGRPVEGATADASPAAGPQTRAYPVPGTPGGASSRATTGRDGRAVLRAPVDGPVDVSLQPSHAAFLTEPAVVHLDRGGGRAEFRVIPSCVLRVQVLDAASGRPIEGAFQFALRRPGSDEIVSGFSTTNPDGSGIGELATGLAAGTYDVEVSAEGRRPERIAAVAFDRAGALREIASRLEPAKAAPSGRMVLAWGDAAGAGGAAGPAEADPEGWDHPVMLRRSGPEPGEWFEPLPDGGVSIRPPVGRSRYDAARHLTTIEDLPPGAYDVLAWDLRADRCAWAHGVRVPEGNVGTVRLDPVPGVRVAIRDLVGPAAAAKGLGIEAEPLGRLPAIRFAPGMRGDFGPQDEVDATYVLGPFPFDAVTATVSGADGAPRRFAVSPGRVAPAPR